MESKETMPSAWVKHVQSVYAKGKSKGMSYKQAMVAAKKTWASKKSGKAPKASKEAPAEEEQDPPAKKKRRRKKRSPSE